jgi:hypothetical protein
LFSGVNLGAGTGDSEKTRGDRDETTVLLLSRPMFSLFAAEAVKFRVGVGSLPEPAVPGVAGLPSAATPEVTAVLGGTNFATLSGVHAKPLQGSSLTHCSGNVRLMRIGWLRTYGCNGTERARKREKERERERVRVDSPGTRFPPGRCFDHCGGSSLKARPRLMMRQHGAVAGSSSWRAVARIRCA